jgi:hypothetical protein
MTTYETGSDNGLASHDVNTVTVGTDYRTAVSPRSELRHLTRGVGKTQEEDDRIERQVEKVRERSQTAGSAFDPIVLDRAMELLANLDINDQLTVTVNMTEIAATIAALWETANHTTPIHRMILAALDVGVLSALAGEAITQDHVDAIREALGDLAMKTVSEAQAEAVRSRFVDLGKKPLFFLDDAE